MFLQRLLNHRLGVFALAFQSPLTVTQFGFPGGFCFSSVNLFLLHRSSPLLYAASLKPVEFGNQRK